MILGMEKRILLPVLVGILILGTLGLSPEAFAQGGRPSEIGPPSGTGLLGDILAAIDDLQNQINNLVLAIAGLVADLATETSDRISADNALQNQIDTIELTPGPQGSKGSTGPLGSKGSTGPTGTVLEAQSCAPGVFVTGIDGNGNLLCGAISAACPSGFIEISYFGEVIEINDSDNLLIVDIMIGETISGSYCYDPNAPDNDDRSEVGNYFLEFYTVAIGDDDFTCDNTSHLRTTNNFSDRDSYSLICNSMSPSISEHDIALSIMFLQDDDQTIFTDDSLPQSLPDFNEFESTVFTWNFGEFDIFDASVGGIITSMTQLQ